ncbi:MAG: Uma2 family endonuclease [Cytophagales bacterium]
MLTLQKTVLDEYLQLPEGAKYQLIKGEIIEMPSPTDYHQEVLFILTVKLGNFLLQNKIGVARFAPLDVHLDEENVFQPDLLYVSNENKHIIKDRIYGAPDLVVEVLAPSTAYYDWEEKKEIYAKYGVKEYWIINPNKRSLEIYHNKNAEFDLVSKTKENGLIKSDVIVGFEFELSELFQKL